MVSGYDGCNRSVVDRLLLVKYWYLYGSVDRPRTTTVVLEDGTVIEDSIILPNALVGRNCRITRAIINEGAVVEDNTVIGDAEGDIQVFGETKLSI